MKKTVSRALLTIVALAFTFSLSAQYAGVTLEYVKLKPGQNNAYLELEEFVLPLHHARVEKGIITRWGLYKKLYTSQNDPYDYILVSSNDDFKKTQNPYPQDLIDANYTMEEQAEFWKNASASRTIVKNEYYDRVTFTEGVQAYKYLRFTRYQVDNNQEFEKLRRDLVKPLFDELVKRGINAGWSVWKKDPNDRMFQYVAVNTYAEFGDWKNGLPLEEIFKEVFPDKDLNEARNAVTSTRTEINSEIWKLVMSTDKPAE